MVLLLLACAADPQWEHDVDPTEVLGPEPACEEVGEQISCAHHVSGYHGDGLDRVLRWQVPPGQAPAAGWPVALVFQGTWYSTRASWRAGRDDAWGGWWQVQLTAALLQAGFAVLTPGTRYDATFWQTNVLPWAVSWAHSADHRWMVALFDAIDGGALGPLDPRRVYATGISSGGYMTSRVAITVPARLRAVAIQSASYATCGGALCVVPELPDDHPPTLFLHGERDEIVPVGTMRRYASALQEQGSAVEQIVDPEAHHGWLPEAPQAITEFFQGW